MLLCALLLLGSALSTPAYADSVTVATGYSDSYFQTFSSKGVWVDIGTPAHYITETGQVVYCVQTSKTEPSNAAYYEVSGESVFSSYAVRRGIELIIQNGYPGTTNGFSDAEARYATANAIRFFLVDCGEPYVPTWMDLDAYGQFFRAKAGYEALWDWCLYLRSLANNQGAVPAISHSVQFSNSNLSLSENGDYFTGQTTVRLSGCEGGYRLDSSSLPYGSSVYGYTGNDGDVLTINIPVGYEQGSYTLYAAGEGYASDSSLEFYAPSYDSSLQTVVSYVGAELSLSEVANASMTVNTPSATPRNCSIIIYKRDSSTNALLPNAGFRLYDAEGLVAEGYTDSSGSLTFSDLPSGEYNLAEFEAPEGYMPDESIYSFWLDTSGQSIELDVYNQKVLAVLDIQKLTADTLAPLSGVGYRLYDADGNQVREGYTDSDGAICFSELPLGSYTLKEFSAPEGFICSEETSQFTFTHTHLAESVTLYNERKTASITVHKLNATGESVNGVAFLLEYSTDDGNGWVTVSQQLTDRNGYVIWDGLSTSPGTLYRLTETATVSGLSLQAEAIFEGSLSESGVYDLSFTVCNYTIPTLPFTGGSGFGYIPVLTLMLCMGFFVALILNKRKETI